MKKYTVNYSHMIFSRARPELVEGCLRALEENHFSPIFNWGPHEKNWNGASCSGRAQDKWVVSFLIIISAMMTSSYGYALSYDKAAYDAQNGQWQNAYEKLNVLLVDSPDRAEVLYDAGVAAYNLKSFSESAACFMRAAGRTDDKNLRIESYFNAGNTLVELHELKKALEQYEKIFELDAMHEYARHNYDRVKQMLQEEQDKKEQQQDDKHQKNDDKNDDKNNEQNENKHNEQQDQDGNEDQSDGDEKDEQNENQQNSNQQKQNKKSDQSQEKSEKESQGKDGDKTERGGKKTQRKDHGNAKKDQKNSDDNQNGNRNDQFQKGSHDTNKKNDAQNGDQHKQSPEKSLDGSNKDSISSGKDQKQDGSSSKAVDASAFAAGMNNVEQKIQDPWLLSVLNDQEERDKAMNKHLMEAKINQHGGKDGQNCW